MKDKLKNIVSFLLRFGVSAALLWWLSKQVDFEKTSAALKTADLNYFFLAFAVFFVIYFVLLLRWLVFVRALDLKVPLATLARYFAIGLFGNLFLPSSIGGDAIKIYGLCKHSAEKQKVVASVLLDRLSGYAGLVITASIACAFGYKLMNNIMIPVVIAVLAAVWAGVMAVLLNERLYAFFCQVLNRFPKAKEAVMKMHYDIALLHNRRYAFWQTAGLSCIAQLMYSFVFFLLAKTLHQDIAMIYCLIFVPLICVASAFPSIGGLGVREYAVKVLFSTVGIDPGIAVSISLINFVFMVVVGLLGGAAYVSTLSLGRVQHHQSDPGLDLKKA